jgi:MtN3 and saliva related transmembrane protein
VPAKELLGFIGGALTTLGFIPQVERLIKMKSAREISLPFTLSFLIGVACWLIYGIILKLFPVILWNGVSLCLMFVMLYIKVKYGK